MNKKVVLLLVFFFGLVPLFAQEEKEEKPFVIENVDYHILAPTKKNPTKAGRTKVAALHGHFGNMEGQGFDTAQELELFLQKYQQKMVNSHFFTTVLVETTATRQQNNQTLVSVAVTAHDGLAYLPMPSVGFSSSTGFSTELANYINNTGGYLFNTIIIGGITFPMVENKLLWTDPSWRAGFIFDKIRAGPIFLAYRLFFKDNRLFVLDRGESIFNYRSFEIEGYQQILWPFSPNWQLEGSVLAFGTLKSETSYLHPSWQNYTFDKPAHFGVEPTLALHYNDTVYLDGAYRGTMAKLKTGYIISSPYSQQEEVRHTFRFNVKYGHFWRPTNFFFPSLTAEFYWKTGQPEFDLARFTNGILKSEWRGNGGFFLRNWLLFKIINIEKLGQVQLGPSIEYGLVLEPNRVFAISDQGFALGLTLATYIKKLPSLPFYATLAVDSRYRTDNPTFVQRVNFAMYTTYNF